MAGEGWPRCTDGPPGHLPNLQRCSHPCLPCGQAPAPAVSLPRRLGRLCALRPWDNLRFLLRTVWHMNKNNSGPYIGRDPRSSPAPPVRLLAARTPTTRSSTKCQSRLVWLPRGLSCRTHSIYMWTHRWRSHEIGRSKCKRAFLQLLTLPPRCAADARPRHG